jgi:hypothetical protein
LPNSVSGIGAGGDPCLSSRLPLRRINKRSALLYTHTTDSRESHFQECDIRSSSFDDSEEASRLGVFSSVLTRFKQGWATPSNPRYVCMRMLISSSSRNEKSAFSPQTPIMHVMYAKYAISRKLLCYSKYLPPSEAWDIIKRFKGPRELTALSPILLNPTNGPLSIA